MKKYTQQEFTNLPVVDGARQCPTGDYTAIKSFGSHCSFDSGCSFGYGCSFGSHCSFDSGCSFGYGCSFGSGCSFDSHCSFGSCCSFGYGCSFGSGCSFDSDCRFDPYCSFGSGCSFGSRCRFDSDCSFGSGCSFEGHKAKDGYPFLSIAGAGSANRTTYFFNTVDGIFVRSGCFFGTLAEFRGKVLQDCAADSLKGIQYLGMADIVEKTWKA